LYFHNGNHTHTTIFNKNECINEEIYVSAMKEGHYLKSDIPYFFISTNGHISISTQIRTFGYYDSNNLLLETIDLTLITECPLIIKPVVEKGTEEKFQSANLWLFLTILLFVLSVIIINKRRLTIRSQ
jgi:hypothetical protein